ncbi:MAG: prolipoprotein diacylglyceryl transferase [Oligoflexales bacterium]|nr:prolipoprotein diacylglyceryl transferase [Oligoflexales bacterium]
MYPILWSSGQWVIPSWHVFFLLGAFTAYFVLHTLFRLYEPLLSDHLNPFYVFCYSSCYLGARVFSLLVEDKASLFSLSGSLLQHGAMTFYGGFLGASIAGLCYCYLRKLSLTSMMDLAFPAGFSAVAIGRIGCFLNGDDYGIKVQTSPSPWWAVTFPPPHEAVPRVPVQLIEALCLFFILLTLFFFFAKIRSKWGKGAIGFLMLSSYCILRFFDEFLRGDDRGILWIPTLSPAQTISSLLLLLLFFLWIVKRYRRRHD